MLDVKLTAGIYKAKHVPTHDPGIRALQGLGERLLVKLLHHSGAGHPCQGTTVIQSITRPVCRARMRPKWGCSRSSRSSGNCLGLSGGTYSDHSSV